MPTMATSKPVSRPSLCSGSAPWLRKTSSSAPASMMSAPSRRACASLSGPSRRMASIASCSVGRPPRSSAKRCRSSSARMRSGKPGAFTSGSSTRTPAPDWVRLAAATCAPGTAWEGEGPESSRASAQRAVATDRTICGRAVEWPRMPTAPSTADDARAGPAPSFAQQRLWVMDRLGAGTGLHIPLPLRLRGPLQADALERALNAIARRHEPLRSSFESHEGRPALRVAAEPAVRLVQRDLRGEPAATREALAERLAREDSDRPFDLSVAPLLRATLLRLADEDHLVAITVDHIVADAWSLGGLIDELDLLLGAAGGAALRALPAG